MGEISKAMIYFDIKKFKTLDYFKYLEEMRKEKEYLSFVKYMELTRNKPCIIPKIYLVYTPNTNNNLLEESFEKRITLTKKYIKNFSYTVVKRLLKVIETGEV